MGPIVIYYHVNIMESDFKLARQGLYEFVHPCHKGLKSLLKWEQKTHFPQNFNENWTKRLEVSI